MRILLGLLAMCSCIPMAKAQFDHLPDGEPYPAAISTKTLRYGTASHQKIWLSRGKGKRAPVIVMLGGGHWQSNAGADWFFLGTSLATKGYAIAYVRTDRVTKTGRDSVLGELAQAIHFLRSNAEKHKLDADRIALLGNGTGSALIGLVATDPTITNAAGVPFTSIKTAILMDSDGLDAAAEILEASGSRKDELEQAFGKTGAEQTAHSAVGHVALPNAPSFLVLAFPGPASRAEMAEAFAGKLKQAGSNVVFDKVPGRSVGRDPNSFGMLANSKTRAIVEHLEASMK